MRRKIIKQGNNSYTLTLPIKWIRELEIKDNSDLEILEEDNSLIISLPKEAKKILSSIELDINDYNERTIRNILFQTYRKGYDQIVLSYNSKEQLLIIKNITRATLLGFEVVKIEDNKCIIENIAEPSENKFSTILRKIFFTIQDESPQIISDILNNKFNNLRKYQESKDLIDTYTNFCRRLIIKNKIPDSKNSYLLLILVSRLSLIYHAYFYMYKSLSSQKSIILSNKTINIISDLPNLFNLLSDSFYKKDLTIANEISISKDKIIYSSIYNALRVSKGNENIILYHAGEIVRLIHLSSISLFGLTDLELK